MSEPTRGPFRVSHENSGGGRNIVDRYGRIVAHTSETQRGKHAPIGSDEAEANAYLLAAAPQMLLVLTTLDMGTRHDSLSALERQLIREAIQVAVEGYPS